MQLSDTRQHSVDTRPRSGAAQSVRACSPRAFTGPNSTPLWTMARVHTVMRSPAWSAKLSRYFSDTDSISLAGLLQLLKRLFDNTKACQQPPYRMAKFNVTQTYSSIPFVGGGNQKCQPKRTQVGNNDGGNQLYAKSTFVSN